MPPESVVDRLAAWREQMPRPALQAGGGGGTSDGMEARVATLEAHLAHIQDDVSGLKSNLRRMQDDVGAIKLDVATLKERVPSKTFIVQALVGGMALFAGVIAFEDQIRHLVGLH